MKLQALEYEFPTQTVENKKSREKEAERRKEYTAGFNNFLQSIGFLKGGNETLLFLF